VDEPLDELYFQWLYSQVADPRAKDPSLTYWKLLRLLYSKEFVWLVPNDDNRIEDGKDLRRIFLQEKEIDPDRVDSDWMDLGCSVLELMVALSQKLAFEAEGSAAYWFWDLMRNIGLNRYNDRGRLPKSRVEDILNDVIFRQYDADGTGGFFPLRNPQEDQRQIELWYQMSSYILEMWDERGMRGG